METRRIVGRTLVGLILIAAGLAIFGCNMGLIPFQINDYIFNWRIFFVIFGIIHLFKPKQFWVGIVSLIAGFLFYAPMIFNLNIDTHAMFWPVLLVTIGFFIILKKNNDHKCYKKHPHFWEAHCNIKDAEFEEETKKSETNDNYIEDVCFFSGGEKIISSKSFEGGSIVAVFGGINLNLKKAELSPNKNSLEVVMIFGGCKLFVPSDWNVRIETVSVFGGFVDKRVITDINPNPEKTLILKGVTIFGGGEIRNY